ncbi:hypothetical protein [Sphingobium sp. EP60837]|uniref:hypothetical protein n=1 Tax=Sphingobium sp. EP60837 TaxID=1855519 RepID=UPI0007DDBE75|nr:hypothetical protein [Sphingobium sp. EP60837]ANI78993.1 hypothetical protein EP837_02598 [Sphingobium sp. EP60837]
MSIQDALHHLDDALDALALEAYRGQDTGSMERVPAIQATLAIELERIDMALGGQSMFAPIAEEIKRAVIAIVAAKESLGDRA